MTRAAENFRAAWRPSPKSRVASTAARFTVQQRPDFVDVGVLCEYLAQSPQLSVMSLHQPFLLPVFSFRTVLAMADVAEGVPLDELG